MVFGTLRSEYGARDACVPVSLTLMNRGNAILSLSQAQATALTDMTVGVYTNSRLFEDSLEHRAGAAVGPGPFLSPEESTTFATVIDQHRFALYSVPPLGGGVIRRSLNLEGPFGTGSLFELGRIDFVVDVDFGVLPDHRVADPAAGVEFVEGELLVGFVNAVPLADAEEIVRRHGSHIVDASLFRDLGSLLVSIPFDRTTGEIIAELTLEPDVRYASRNDFSTID